MGARSNIIKNNILIENILFEQDRQGKTKETAASKEGFEYGSLEWWHETVDIEKLDELLRSFARLFQVGVCLLTPKGRKVILVSVSEFCDYVHSIRKGKAICDACDKRALRTSLKQGDIHIYTCSNGLTDLCAPLHINGRLAGFLASGQVQPGLTGDAELEAISRRWTFVRNDEERAFLMEKYRQLPVMDETELKRALEIIRLLSTQIVELCEINLARQKILEQSLLLSQQRQKSAGMEHALHRAQLKALRSQINPHFLFNSLNCIARLALFEAADRTVEMTEQLADYLRYTLQEQGEHGLVSLGEELQCVRSYLAIYRVRFGDRLSFFIKEDPEVRECLVPFMLIQPLAENALIHGLEPSLREGRLLLTAKKDGDAIHVVLRDNGVGFKASGFREGMGLANVRKRLSLYYGESASLDVRSVPCGGTRVELRLPEKPVNLP